MLGVRLDHPTQTDHDDVLDVMTETLVVRLHALRFKQSGHVILKEIASSGIEVSSSKKSGKHPNMAKNCMKIKELGV